MSKTTVTPESVAKSMATLEAQWKPGSEAKDGTTLQQLEIQRDALRKALKKLDDIRPCCDTCEKFDFVRVCTQHGEIPLEFRSVVGECPDWTLSYIPF